MNTIDCERHGPQPETFVCQHIVQTLRDRKPRGFFWADTPDPRPDAWCTECNDRVQRAGGQWTPEAERAAKIKLLCGSCYDEAKALNGF